MALKGRQIKKNTVRSWIYIAFDDTSLPISKYLILWFRIGVKAKYAVASTSGAPGGGCCTIAISVVRWANSDNSAQISCVAS